MMFMYLNYQNRKMKQTFNLILTLTAMLTMAQTATAQEAAVYDLVTEDPDVDGGQSTNWNTEYDYYSLVDGNTSTVYGISNANPWVEFHYSRAFVPKKYILWTGDSWSFAYNPATWTIKAKLNKTDEWTTLATVDNSSGNQLPEADRTSKEFSIESNTKAYKYFRFEATRKNNGTFQLGELQFKEATPKVELTWNMSDQSRCNTLYLETLPTLSVTAIRCAIHGLALLFGIYGEVTGTYSTKPLKTSFK